MKPFTPLGNETLVLGDPVPVVDGGGNAVRDAYHRVVYQTVPQEISVPLCSVRELSATEHDLDVHPTDVVVRCRMPLTYPGPDGAPLPTPVPGPSAPVTRPLTGAQYLVQGRGRYVDDVSSDLDHIVFVARERKG